MESGTGREELRWGCERRIDDGGGREREAQGLILSLCIGSDQETSRLHLSGLERGEGHPSMSLCLSWPCSSLTAAL